MRIDSEEVCRQGRTNPHCPASSFATRSRVAKPDVGNVTKDEVLVSTIKDY